MIDNRNTVNSFILKVGLLLGVAFSATIYIAHLRGTTHIPGDNVSWLNIIIFSFIGIVTGNQYKAVENNNLSFNRAFLYLTKLNLASASILTIFCYIYYRYLAPDDLQEILRQVQNTITQLGTIPDEQTQLLMQIYKSSLSAGTMAFVVLVFQIIGTSIFGLLLANIIRTKKI